MILLIYFSNYTLRAHAAEANPMVLNVIALKLGNNNIGTFLFCAMRIMCFIKSCDSMFASIKMQQTLFLSRALVIAFNPIIIEFLKVQ